MRRFVFASGCVLATAFAASCSESHPAATTEADAGPVDKRPPTPPEWDRPVARVSEAQAAADRAACKFARGALADETLGTEIPVGKDIPIDTIVVIVQENRSFDHYYGHFAKYAGRNDIESAPEDATNPESVTDPQGPKHPWQHGAHLCAGDTDHSWEGSHLEYNGGKNDGFFQANHEPARGRDGSRAMWWYDERELGYYYALAKEFGLADHYHCSLLGPTWPNRMYVVAGTSFGVADNYFPEIGTFPETDAVLFDELERRHVDWKLFTDGGPPGSIVAVGPGVGQRWGADRDVVDTLEEFEQAAKDGKLPAVAFIDANFIKEGDPAAEDEHPPADVQFGQKFVARIVDALTKSPQWNRSALFLTYDENGGIYDHVPPPPACLPDDKTTPTVKDGSHPPGTFDRYGFRVPLLVVSPYTKKGFVSHTTYDHTSILRFIQARFRLPALTGRDANAAIPIDFFDFGNPPHLTPPTLPTPVIDDGEAAYCKATF